ncbi:hypothetical protein GGE07_005868 [Sinorhizobium terangae]|nr:hypothetical protein [Sinorhizobium terangae]
MWRLARASCNSARDALLIAAWESLTRGSHTSSRVGGRTSYCAGVLELSGVHGYSTEWRHQKRGRPIQGGVAIIDPEFVEEEIRSGRLMFPFADMAPVISSYQSFIPNRSPHHPAGSRLRDWLRRNADIAPSSGGFGEAHRRRWLRSPAPQVDGAERGAADHRAAQSLGVIVFLLSLAGVPPKGSKLHAPSPSQAARL